MVTSPRSLWCMRMLVCLFAATPDLASTRALLVLLLRAWLLPLRTSENSTERASLCTAQATCTMVTGPTTYPTGRAYSWRAM